MSIGLAQPGSTSIQPTMSMRMMIPPFDPVFWANYGVAAGGSGMI
jgi:hypothetical protein